MTVVAVSDVLTWQARHLKTTEVLLRKSIGLIELFTFWTCEPIRPAQAFQIGSAGGIVGKNPLKIGKRCWKAAGVHSGKLSPIHRIDNKPDRQGRIMLRRPLPARASPFSRRRLPRQSEPVKPA